MDANAPPAHYDVLLRQAVETYNAAQVEAARTIKEMEARIEKAREVAREATERYHAQLEDLAQRRLAGEFKDEGRDEKEERHERHGAGYRDTEKQIEAACRALLTPESFIAADAEKAYGGLFPELPAIKRGTLNGALAKLVGRDVLYVVEAGYKRKPTRYGFKAPEADGTKEEVSE